MKPEYHINDNLTDIVMPVNHHRFQLLLKELGYPEELTEFIAKGFQEGFDIEYNGPVIRQSSARNLPFTIGNSTILWNKIMERVKLGRVAGPFDAIPYQNYIQSPIGLVLKDDGRETRLISHLSYDFPSHKSLNYHTPQELCSVRYQDLNQAVKRCLVIIHRFPPNTKLFFGKTDIQSAFRILPLLAKCWKWLIIKAKDPKTGIFKFFVDKCLPFGASISCALFQKVSDGLAHILRFKMALKNPRSHDINNYFDDFYFWPRPWGSATP